MPTGPGLYYQKIGNHFKIKSMLATGKASSLECLEWLQWEQARCPHKDVVIQNAFNFGEKTVAGHSLDGYLEIKRNGDVVFTVGYQYFGCYWHFCPNRCEVSKKSKATLADGQKDARICEEIRRKVNRLIIKRSCEWMIEREALPVSYKSPDYCFLGRTEDQVGDTKITEKMILQKIASGDFYGMIRADVSTPPEIIAKYEHLNFPFIFRKCVITEEMLSPKMKEMAKMSGKDFPKETRTLTWNAKDIVLTTPTVQQYLELEMQVSNIQWAVEYKPTRPFEKFVDGMVKTRIKAHEEDNIPLGERAKFCLNSCVGRFGLVNLV